MASSTIGRDMAGPSLPEKVDLPHHVDRNTLSDRAKRSLAWKSSQIAKFPVPVRRPVRRAQYWSRDATHPLSTLPPGEDPFVNKQAADPRHSATSGEVESEAPTGSEGLEIIKNVPNSQMPSTKPTQTQIEHAATLKAQEAENIQRLEQHFSEQYANAELRELRALAGIDRQFGEQSAAAEARMLGVQRNPALTLQQKQQLFRRHQMDMARHRRPQRYQRARVERHRIVAHRYIQAEQDRVLARTRALWAAKDPYEAQVALRSQLIRRLRADADWRNDLLADGGLAVLPAF